MPRVLDRETQTPRLHIRPGGDLLVLRHVRDRPSPTDPVWHLSLRSYGQETYNLLQEHRIENVVMVGVHLNMCVLGRPFGIRQMVKMGKNVALMRDLTDTMYNPAKRPQVSHFEGTDLVVQHVERHWCPSFTSSDITGRPPFRFKADSRAAK